MIMYSFDSPVVMWRNPENRKATKTILPLWQAMEKMEKLGYSVDDYLPDNAGFVMGYSNPKTKTTYTIIYAENTENTEK